MKEFPDIANRILSGYFDSIDESLPGFLKGFYVYGSLTLGDFHPEKSDIDFIAITDKRLTADEITKLDKIHRLIQKAHRKPNLNGIYLTLDDIGKSEEMIPPFPYFFEGRMHPSGKMDLHNVTWHQLKNNAVALRGEELSLLIDTDISSLKKEMKENAQSYWGKWIYEHSGNKLLKSIALLLFEQKTEWGVLGLARQIYTVDTGEITSKLKAGEYCRDRVPHKYRKILDEALRIRKGSDKSMYRSNKKRKKDVLNFMNFAKEYVTSSAL